MATASASSCAGWSWSHPRCSWKPQGESGSSPGALEPAPRRRRGGHLPREASGLAAKLVKRGVLTAYQGRYLLHGRGESCVRGATSSSTASGGARWGGCTRPATS